MSAPYEKAIEETAKTTGKAIDAASGAGKFAAQIFGATINELAGWSHDVILAKRVEWQANNVEKFVENVRKLKRAGAPVKPVPARQASLLLDAVANEDDPGIQELWAKLIDAATDSAKAYEIKRVHIDVLQSIDPPEAIILKTIRGYLNRNPNTKRIDGFGLGQDSGLGEPNLTIYLHHLATLGCFIASDRTVLLATESSPGPPAEITTQTATFQITELLSNLFDILW